MKKNGYLRKFIAMFLVFVMLMADSSMTTFANSFTVGRVKQQNADEGVAVQSSNDVNVTVNAPDGTYYLAIMKDNDIKATKNVDNNPATDEKYSGKFSFDLQQKDGENWKTIDSVTNVNSSIVFNNLGKFKTEGTHFYRIVETASALNDVTIDSNPVYVKAVIKKNGNKLIATVTYYSDKNYSIAVSNPSFNNTTVQQKTDITFGGTKTLTGKTLADKQFTFELQETNDKWEALDGVAAQTVQNDGAGNFSFGKIEYDNAGTHYYTVKEQSGGQTVEGITYDKTVYQIKVTVRDDGKGKLVATAEGADAQALASM